MIQIETKVLSRIIDHALKDAPIEACGYLAGSNGAIVDAIPMTNADNSPTHYSFTPEEQFSAVKSARRKNMRILATYHSHPETPARMSKEDIKLAFDTSLSYFIVSLAGEEPVVKAFRVVDGSSREEEIRIIP